MSASEHLNPRQFSHAEVAEATGEYYNGMHNARLPDSAQATFRHLPVAHLSHLASPVSEEHFGEHQDPRGLPYVQSMVETYRKSPQDLPPLVLHQVGETLHMEDGWHRLSAANAAGVTHVPAHVFKRSS